MPSTKIESHAGISEEPLDLRRWCGPDHLLHGA